MELGVTQVHTMPSLQLRPVPQLFMCDTTAASSVLYYRMLSMSYRGKAWGVKMSLSKRTVHPGGVAVPPLLQCLIPRMQQLPPLRTFNPNEANAIDYWRGIHHLKPHMDDRKLSTEVIVNLSLSGRAVMTFTKQPIAGNKAGNAGGQHQVGLTA